MVEQFTYKPEVEQLFQRMYRRQLPDRDAWDAKFSEFQARRIVIFDIAVLHRRACPRLGVERAVVRLTKRRKPYVLGGSRDGDGALTGEVSGRVDEPADILAEDAEDAQVSAPEDADEVDEPSSELPRYATI